MLEIFAILLIFLLCYVLILKNFDYSIYLLIILSVLLHKELFSFYSWNLMPIRAYMLALVCASITKIYFDVIKKKNIKKYFNEAKDPVFIALIVLWVIRGLSIIFTKNLQQSLLLYAFFTTIVFLCAYLYLKIKKNPGSAIKYIKFYIYLVFVLTIFGYIQILVLKVTGVTIGALWSIPGNIPRVGATFWDVNHYGALISSLLPVLGIFILSEPKLKTKIIYSLMFISMCVSLFLTNSRSAWIMAFVTLVVFVCVLLIRKFKARGILYLLFAIIALASPLIHEYTIKSSPFRAKIKQYFHYRMDSFDSHFLLLTGAMQVFEKYPVLGGGYGSFFEQFSKTEIAPTYFGRDPAALNTRVPAHTIWGELISETGILGLTTYIVLCLLLILPPLYLGLNSKDKKEYLLGSAIGSLLIGWMAAGIFYSYNSEFFWIAIFLYCGWSAGTLIKYTHMKNVFSFFLTKEKTALTFLILLSALMIFTSLGRNHLIPYDEAIYAKISKNMVLQNNFLVQNWIPGKVWYEKPPLYMWVSAGFMKLLGFASWAPKLPSAIFGFLTIITVYIFSKKLFGKTAGFLSAFVLLTITQFLYYTRTAMLDVSVTFFITLALALYCLAKRNGKSFLMILSGACIGLAVMTKGVVGLLPFPVILFFEIYLLTTKKQKIGKKLIFDNLLLLVFSIIIFIPWHLEMIKLFGQDFLKNYIGYHVWDRAVSAIEDKGRPFYWYFIVFRVSMRIWLGVFIIALPYIIYKIFRKTGRQEMTAGLLGKIDLSGKDNEKLTFLMIWSLIVFLFFSSAKSKLVWYILPIYPALSILIGYFLAKLLNFLMVFVKDPYKGIAKIFIMFFIVTAYLFYIFLNKDLVYTSDLTGSQARLLQYKDSFFGKEKMVYVDRIELPLSLYYTDGPFIEIDFNPQKKEKVPSVSYTKELILLTKKGRYSDEVVGYKYGPKIVLEDGDWILWYFESEYDVDKGKLSEVQKEISNINAAILKGSSYTGNLYQLKIQEAELTDKISSSLGSH